MIDTVSTPPETIPYQYKACTKNGKVFAALQSFPPDPIQEGEFEISQTEFYFLRDMILSHHTDMRKLRSMASRIQNKINKLEKQ